MVKGVIGFVAGVILGVAVLYLTLIPRLEERNKLAASQQKEQSGDLTKQVGNLQSQVGNLQSQIQTLTTQRDTCAGKFERVTLLYDIGLLGGETRAWAIPADVEPKVIGIKRGTYSHYDPKTQTETVHLNPGK
jgi:hypothetical protein